MEAVAPEVGGELLDLLVGGVVDSEGSDAGADGAPAAIPGGVQ